MINVILQIVVYTVILVLLAVPLGKYMGKVFSGEQVFLSPIVRPIEKFLYKLLKIDEEKGMGWKQYAGAVLMFNLLGFIVIYLLQILQKYLPLNPEGIANVSSDLAFNTAASFATNTNWQAYSGETTLSYLTQMLGLSVQNFLSAAVGIAVLVAVIRGFMKRKSKEIGNFWVDLTKSLLYILLPLSIVISLFLVSQGVVQNFKEYQEVKLIDPYTLEDGTIIDSQIIPGGPAASQIAIKQLGTNGGGFFGVNSAHPLENPNLASNVVEVTSILLIAVALCFTFGYMVKDKKQGRAIFLAMFIIYAICLVSVGALEQKATPQIEQNGIVDISYSDGQSGGNMEGKEVRFGIASSSFWAVTTTAASNGSVNSMHDSYTPLGGGIIMLLMQLGEVIFGGVGSGLYGMVAFIIMTVFISGLMVGRTPEYLGKKIEPFEMKMASLAVITTPLIVVIGTAIACVIPSIQESLNNGGAHGFSEILYALSSAGNNNGSAFAGFSADTVPLNILLGIAMLLARFVPIVLMLAISGSIAKKKYIPSSAGTLATNNGVFVTLLIIVVLMIGALSFFPALALGPIVEQLQMLF
ncbi:potassium-transporting ATPase subunit KdpA [Clostridium sp. D53t1_180928_C8]|uniref:potassium-transporting ATPase subunit KdpA n=1 Tax=Clostridium sp. D53t1_180928_C8 TaxID=2787101 RepID=UPI0018A99229|nr:potassium-transporting ATPase subunit KdpA [Clostridium sp. D53t1_180928_C8]